MPVSVCEFKSHPAYCESRLLEVGGLLLLFSSFSIRDASLENEINMFLLG